MIERRTERVEIRGAFHEDMTKLAKHDDDFRRVVFTGPNSQLVLMCIQPGEALGEERHSVDPLFYFVAGSGEAIIDGQVSPVEEHDAVLVPAGTAHNFRNTGGEPLRLFTSDAPPQHPDGTVHRQARGRGRRARGVRRGAGVVRAAAPRLVS